MMKIKILTVITLMVIFILISGNLNEKQEENTPLGDNPDYGLAFNYEKQGRLEEARASFEKYILTNKGLFDEATIHVARLYSASKKSKDAIVNYLKIKRESPLYEISRHEALQTAIDGSEYGSAMDILNEILPRGNNDIGRRQYLSKIPPSLWDIKEARSICESVFRGNYGDEPFLLKAVRHYSESLNISYGEELTYQEGRNFYFAGYFKDALEALAISMKSSDIKRKQESAFLMARCYYRMGEYKRAVMLFEEVRNIKPDSFLSMKAWFLEGRILTFFLKDSKCLPVLSDFILHNSSSGLKSFAELYRAQFLYSEGRKDKALEILKGMRNGGGSAGLFVRAGMTAYICGDIPLADSLLQKASSKGTFFRGLIRFKNGDVRDAEILFSQVKNGLLYPKLSKSEGKLETRIDAPPPSETRKIKPETLPHPFDILIRCGDLEMLQYRLNAIKNRDNPLYDKVRSALDDHSALKTEERYSSVNPYPLYRWNVTYGEAKKYEVDPFLVLAISKEESHFNEVVVSNRGAMGVMQIMPDLARSILQNEGKGFIPSMVRDPELCMHIGIKNLSGLLRHYENDVFFTVASYNAGKSTVDIWLDFFKVKDPIIFLGLIPFDETQKYVEKVIDSYLEYQKRYGINKPHSSSYSN